MLRIVSPSRAGWVMRRALGFDIGVWVGLLIYLGWGYRVRWVATVADRREYSFVRDMGQHPLDHDILRVLKALPVRIATTVQGVLLIGMLLSGWVVLEGTGRLMVPGGVSDEAPLRKYPIILIIAYVLFSVCIFGTWWQKRTLAKVEKQIKELMSGVTLSDVLNRSLDKSSSQVMSQVVGFVSLEPIELNLAYAAIKNWEDGSLRVFETLMKSKADFDLIAQQGAKISDKVNPVIMLLSFSPLAAALVLGIVMVQSQTLILDKFLSNLMMYLFAAGLCLPLILFVIPAFKAEKLGKEENYVMRLSSQQVAWMGMVWGDYSLRELMQRSKNGDRDAKALKKTMQSRRGY